MKIENIDVDQAIDNVRERLEKERNISPALRGALELLLLLVTALLGRVTLNSRNSSKPPSSDPNRKKKNKGGKTGRKPGGQKGHRGQNLKPVEEPDKIETILVDESTLPEGEYKSAGYETRQVIDIDISRIVTEYRAQILIRKDGRRVVARFPDGVTQPVQYGNSVKAHAVYHSQFQLIPYDRLRDLFEEQMRFSISAGSLFNFNKAAYRKLSPFEQWLKGELIEQDLLHADETGINIGGNRRWLHCASNAELTYFYPHDKRGGQAMDEMGVLPEFKGILCHDHWKPYYRFDCAHALCNAHHLRELERAFEQDDQKWAGAMKALLLDINRAVDEAGGRLMPDEAGKWRRKYRQLLKTAGDECPAPDESGRKKGQRGRLKRSRSRNLLERLQNYEQDVLRFMENAVVPFTNNQGENDLRMTKVQQKISGCFRAEEGAKIFCLVRSYISTCRKQGLTATHALTLLFEGKNPDFMKQRECAE